MESLIKLNPKMLGKSAICYTDECFPYKSLLFHDLKEIEFHYNYSGKEIFGRLCRYLVGFIPER